MKVVHIVGARPNFMKVGPVIRAMDKYPRLNQVLVHTGQHYDENMSQVFFKQLDLPEPDVNLGVGSGRQGIQTARIIERFEEYAISFSPDLLMVYGDVNSTMATSIVAAKLGIKIAHVEAGLRSNDRGMPEEINRIITDNLADVLFTPSNDANENLLKEGINNDKIHLIGNVMIDTLVNLLPQAEKIWEDISRKIGITNGNYGVVTLHRPSNVDNPEELKNILNTICRLSQKMPIVFPIHPRTLKLINNMDISYEQKNSLHITEPMGYLEFLALQKYSNFVITDSGGLQEESSFLGVPCFTVRKNTERPITVTNGTNMLVGDDMDLLYSSVEHVMGNSQIRTEPIPLWDGNAGKRIAAIIEKMNI
jgi:UDP-N-acetylglucosamine 2-epimerase (non-hydrolysing)